MSDENDSSTLTGLMSVYSNSNSIALAKAEAFALNASNYGIEYTGLSSTKNFLSVGGNIVSMATPVAVVAETYINMGDVTVALEEGRNAAYIGLVSTGVGALASLPFGGNPVVYVAVSGLTNWALTAYDVDLVEVIHGEQDLTFSYTSGDYTYQEIFNPADNTLTYTAENASIPGIENNATTLKLNDSGTVIGMARVDNNTVVDINLETGAFSIEDAGVTLYGGNLSDDPSTIPTNALAVVTTQLNTFNSEFQTINPDFDITDTQMGALVTAGNDLVATTIDGDSVVFTRNTSIVSDSETSSSIFVRDHVRIEETSGGYQYISYTDPETGFTEFLVNHADGTKSLLLADETGQLSRVDFNNSSELTEMQAAKFTFIAGAAEPR